MAKTQSTQTDKANDILVDYELLCGSLTNLLEVLELASSLDNSQTYPILYTANHALRQIIIEHGSLTEIYRKELTP
ncbi:hypothetical protein HPA88_00500 [Streptococcus suis]|uniref:Uncharacterized protein n=1 Tax=Streptococcus suis TaxID=1307 RepID=A0A116N7X3_STRSU|nr:hypothetical protein [Streptococcus suis]MBL6514817.1 hypothetical protein [Streptococcus suis]MBM7153139.1 hypothetical protein [Streptococcus suis]MDG4502933.1 hypothetical protein [Streptococcus suis]NQG46694.1 hypothetical protein [Streptococcus suis]NQH51360.1 hypothetical protein [Streptococcus suis]